MAIVEIALNRSNEHVVSILNTHLQALHFRNAFVGIEHGDFRARNVAEAFQSRFSRIAARRRKNQNFVVDPRDFTAFFQKIGQNGQRHILKGAGRTVEQLQNEQFFVDFNERSRISTRERSVRFAANFFQVLRAEIVGEIFSQHERRAIGIIHLRHRFHFFLRNRGEAFGYEQTAVFCKSLYDRLRSRYSFTATRTDKIHFFYLPFVNKRTKNGQSFPCRQARIIPPIIARLSYIIIEEPNGKKDRSALSVIKDTWLRNRATLLLPRKRKR